MTDQDRNKAWGFTLFCDDVRSEIGGKFSLMGLYQADMFFPESVSLPFMVPKIVAAISYFEIHGALNEDVSFKVTIGDGDDKKLLAELPALRKDIMAQAPAMAEPEGNPEDSERIFSIRLPVTMSPFAVEKMGRLRVRAHYSDGKILKLGGITLKQVPDSQFQSLLGLIPAIPPANV